MTVAAATISPVAISPGSSASGIQRTSSASSASGAPTRSAPRARYARIDVAAGQLPQPPVDDEPVPPDQQDPLGGLVQYDRHRAPRQAHHVLVEERAVGQLQRGDAQPELRILIYQPVGANLPSGPFGTIGHQPEATRAAPGEPGRRSAGLPRWRT